MLQELENTVLKLTKRSIPQQSQGTSTRGSKESIGNVREDEIAESSSGALKTTKDMKILKKMVKQKVEESIEDIIEETAGEFHHF